MIWDTTILKSKLARRFFAMFVICALFPILVLAGFTYYRVTRQLEDQAFERLRQSVKAHALSIFEHLLMADQQLQTVATFSAPGQGAVLPDLPRAVLERNAEFFTGLVLVSGIQEIPSRATAISPVILETIEKMKAAKENVRLATWSKGQGRSSVAIVHRMAHGGAAGAFLVGMVDPNFLWGLTNGTILPADTEVCVWDDQGATLYASLASQDVLPKQLAPDPAALSSGQHQISLDGKPFLAAHWSMFLKPRFEVSHWTVMVLEPKDHVFEPLRVFHTLFPLVLLLAFIVVIWLSTWAINRSLNPIASLMEGARKVAARQFTHRVVVHTKDEFSDLAAAFNHMSKDLDSQFQVLDTLAEMDRTILTVPEMERIIATGLKRAKMLFRYHTAAISLLEPGPTFHGRSYISSPRTAASEPQVREFESNAQEIRSFEVSGTWHRFDSGSYAPAYLTALAQPEVACFYVWPIHLDQRLYALVSMGWGRQPPFKAGGLAQIRAFCDHLSVAFSNAKLVRELKELNLGTLYALARTVDAKSSWTAGHSVRVTHLAIHIAIAMGLDAAAQESLRRAGLLHDIGKIGIPITILDKNSGLTEAEYGIIKGHPTMGAQILCPIQAYADIIPIIEQHHERYDGRGYPFGLNGEGIHLLARIMTVADAYDAMVSDRPYRPGFEIEKALQIITAGAGQQFDPQVVEAFLSMGPQASGREWGDPQGMIPAVQRDAGTSRSALSLLSNDYGGNMP